MLSSSGERIPGRIRTIARNLVFQFPETSISDEIIMKYLEKESLRKNQMNITLVHEVVDDLRLMSSIFWSA